jgi:DNA polymerase-3 subunit chi
MGNACQVDFYVLEDAAQSADRLACRLALMAWEQGHSAMLLAGSEAAAERLDALLWESPPGRFIPHGRAGPDGPEPVTVGTFADLAEGCGEVIINLSPEPVPEPGRFQRLLELVPAGEAERARSRDKFRRYRELGLKPASHSLGGG